MITARCRSNKDAGRQETFGRPVRWETAAEKEPQQQAKRGLSDRQASRFNLLAPDVKTLMSRSIEWECCSGYQKWK